MVKKITKKVAVKRTAKVKDDRTDELIGAMTEVVETVKELSGRVSDIENTRGAVDPQEAAPAIDQPIGRVDSETPTEPTKEPDNTCPVPSEYRVLVDDILNKSFGIEVVASPSVPTFEFTVIVPEEYSNVPKDEKEQVQVDRRTKIVTYAEGVAKVEEWVRKIYSNLSEEMKSKVTQDRLTRL